MHKDLVRMLHKLLQTSIGTAVTGFTKAVISCSGVCSPMLLWTRVVWLGTCSFWRKWQPRTSCWNLLPIENTGFCIFWWKTRSFNTVFITTNSLEHSSNKVYCSDQVGNGCKISFVTVPIDALVHPLCVYSQITASKAVIHCMSCYQKEIGAVTLEEQYK